MALNMTAMDYRQYDNAIGRFNSVDPLAEMSYSMTPYHFGNGNPIYFNDPSGLFSNAGEMADALWSQTPTDGIGIMSSDGSGGFNTAVFDTHGTGGGHGTGTPPFASLPGFNWVGSYVGSNGVFHANVGNGNYVSYAFQASHTIPNGDPSINLLDEVVLDAWVKVNSEGNGFSDWAGYANTFNTIAGYASFAGEITNHNWASATFKYGQRINGVVYSSEALTNANRATSLLWATRFAKVGFITSVIGTGISYNNIVTSYNAHGNGVSDINKWDVADATVGTVATASAGASLAIATGFLNPASLGAAAFLVSNPVGWGIAIGATAYFTYRLLSD